MGNCIFCDIVQHKIKADIVEEDNEILAFKDINPQAPIHILIIPKKHIASVNDLTKEDYYIVGKICYIAKKLAEKEKISENGYRLIINTGKNAGQAVSHLHFHLLGGRTFFWPPG